MSAEDNNNPSGKEATNYDDYVEQRVSLKIKKFKAEGKEVTDAHIQQWKKEARIGFEAMNAKPNESMKNAIVDYQTNVRGKGNHHYRHRYRMTR